MLPNLTPFTNRWFCIILCLLAPVAAAPAQTQPATRPATQPSGPDHLITTDHELTINGKPLKYQATAGTMMLRDDTGKPSAQFFFVACCKTDENPNPAARPITFLFNGGPGAAAVWLHLGGVGPQHLALDVTGSPPMPPCPLVDNPQTWLDMTDLVFIDPVGTGYSRPAPGVKAEDFYGVEQDIHSVGQFIRLYITRNDRWSSPKFLAGESYGTTRAAGLSQYLLDKLGIQLNGIILISSVLDFQTIPMGPSNRANDLPSILSVGTYAATAWYHKKLDPDLQADLQKTLAQASQWAMSDYLLALAQGDQLTPDMRHAIAKQLSRFTALPVDYCERANLRIDPGAFRNHLLADQRKIVGRFDTRITGDDTDPAADSAQYDPSFTPYFAAYTAAAVDYFRRTLKFESDLPYETLSDRVGPWNFDHGGHGYLDVAGSLRQAMFESPHLKVLFANGYFDLATPFMSADYTISHMDLSPTLRANITRTFYPSGHMIYQQKESLEKLKTDVQRFMDSAR